MTENIAGTPAEEVKTPDAAAAIAALQERFPGAIKADDRKGYGGIIVSTDKLLEVAQAIRDDYGFNYLSSATAVDYLGQGDQLEMVAASGKRRRQNHELSRRIGARMAEHKPIISQLDYRVRQSMPRDNRIARRLNAHNVEGRSLLIHLGRVPQ